MGKDLAENFRQRDRSLKKLTTRWVLRFRGSVFEGPAEDLQLTENTQPAILDVSVAAFARCESAGISALRHLSLDTVSANTPHLLPRAL